MDSTLRARLTLSYTAVFGIIVAVLAIGSYLLIRSDLYSKLDSALRVVVEVTAISAHHELIEHSQEEFGDDDIQAVLNGQVDPALPQMQILVRHGNRNVAYKRGGSRVADLRTLPLDRIRSGQTFGTLRVVKRELAVPQFKTSYEIFAAESVEDTVAQLWRVKQALMLFVPVGLALAAGAGYLMARRMLFPLKALTDRIGRITNIALRDRVPVLHRNDEIGRLASSFNELLDRLEQTFNLQRRFMADASHELRTPITVALTATQSTRRDPLRTAGDSEEALTIVEEQMMRLRRIVTDMLFLSQADTFALQMTPQDIYLDDAVAEAARAAQTLAKVKRQRVVVESLPEARCFGDGDLLRQAFLVLLENAVKFTPENGLIQIGIREAGDAWICTVTDSGVGIPPEAQEHIFERFFRAVQPTGAKVPGAGLGLPIALSIVEAHRGTLRLIDSRPGHTQFEICIPKSPLPNAETATHASSLVVNG
jgi:two-component system OmpR family sensor kinase